MWRSVLSFHLVETGALLFLLLHCEFQASWLEFPGDSAVSTAHLTTEVLGLLMCTTTPVGSGIGLKLQDSWLLRLPVSFPVPTCHHSLMSFVESAAWTLWTPGLNTHQPLFTLA